MKQTSSLILIFSVLLLINTINLKAQVTIGSGAASISGAILQIKQFETTDTQSKDGSNAKGGIAIPRVKLSDLDNLYPMFETSPGSGIANDQYNTAELKSSQDTSHTGLLVYHPDNNTLKGAGLYVWDGSKWQKL